MSRVRRPQLSLYTPARKRRSLTSASASATSLTKKRTYSRKPSNRRRLMSELDVRRIANQAALSKEISFTDFYRDDKVSKAGPAYIRLIESITIGDKDGNRTGSKIHIRSVVINYICNAAYGASFSSDYFDTMRLILVRFPGSMDSLTGPQLRDAVLDTSVCTNPVIAPYRRSGDTETSTTQYKGNYQILSDQKIALDINATTSNVSENLYLPKPIIGQVVHRFSTPAPVSFATDSNEKGVSGQMYWLMISDSAIIGHPHCEWTARVTYSR